MRLFKLGVFLGISQAQWENYEDIIENYGNEVSEIGSIFKDIDFQNICKVTILIIDRSLFYFQRTPQDDDLVGALNVVREYIEDLDEPITEFLTDKDFQAFTVVDTMKISEGDNRSKSFSYE